MTNYRKILEMYSQGFSQRSIETNVHSSHQTVRAVIDRAAELNIRIIDLNDLAEGNIGESIRSLMK